MNSAASVIRIDPQLARRRTAERMTESQRIPTFHVSRVAVADRLADSARSASVSVTACLLPILAAWLVRFPDLNASYREGNIELYSDVNLGVALSHAENVLVVPTFKACQEWDVHRFATELAGLRDRSRSNAFRSTDFALASFTVSNLGSLGVDAFTSLINPPQIGILSVATLAPRPIVLRGELTVRETLPITLAVDHRALDGAYAARALADLAAAIERID